MRFSSIEVGMREYGFLKNNSFKKLEDLLELKKSPALHQNVNLMVFDCPRSTHSVRSQTSFAHDFLCKENIDDALSSMSKMLALAAHGHVFCSELGFSH